MVMNKPILHSDIFVNGRSVSMPMTMLADLSLWDLIMMAGLENEGTGELVIKQKSIEEEKHTEVYRHNVDILSYKYLKMHRAIIIRDGDDLIVEKQK